MQTTEIKYAIMDRVTGKLLTYYTSPNEGGCCVPTQYILSRCGDSIWYCNTVERANYVIGKNTLWHNADYYTPSHGVDISQATHCVVKVTMVCDVEIVEQIRLNKLRRNKCVNQ